MITTHMSISSIPSPAPEGANEFELTVGQKVARVCIPKKLIDRVSPEDLAVVIAETRRIGELLEKGGRDFEIEDMFLAQIKRQLENAENQRQYQRYVSVMEHFEVEKYFSAAEAAQYKLQKHKIREKRDVLFQRAQHISDQGWSKGSVIESISGVKKIYTIQGISKECRLSLLNSAINNSDPLGFRTRTN